MHIKIVQLGEIPIGTPDSPCLAISVPFAIEDWGDVVVLIVVASNACCLSNVVPLLFSLPRSLSRESHYGS